MQSQQPFQQSMLTRFQGMLTAEMRCSVSDYGNQFGLNISWGVRSCKLMLPRDVMNLSNEDIKREYIYPAILQMDPWAKVPGGAQPSYAIPVPAALVVAVVENAVETEDFGEPLADPAKPAERISGTLTLKQRA